MGEEGGGCCYLSVRNLTVVSVLTQFVLMLMIAMVSIMYAIDVQPLVTSLGIPQAVLLSFMILGAIISITRMILIILVVVGAYMDRAVLLVPWLIMSPIDIAAIVLMQMVFCWYYIGVKTFAFVMWQLVITVAFAFAILLVSAIVYDLYRTIKKCKNSDD